MPAHPTGRWHHLYSTARWQRRRKLQLAAHPLCRYCIAQGHIVPATIVDHVCPHNGDINKFWQGELQSLCVSCHNGRKQEIEKRGFCIDVGADGLPIDPMHPFNRAESQSATRTPITALCWLSSPEPQSRIEPARSAGRGSNLAEVC